MRLLLKEDRIDPRRRACVDQRFGQPGDLFQFNPEPATAWQRCAGRVDAGLLRHARDPDGQVIAHELEILGSHGMQAHRYDKMLAMFQSDKLDPARLVHDKISLAEAPAALMAMD